MPNILSNLNEHIRKLARREVKLLILDAKKRGAEHRRSIAALKREVTALKREVGGLRKNVKLTPKAPAAVPEKARLRIDGLKTHRAKLGLSAKDYGKLLGVSGLTVYNWEAQKVQATAVAVAGYYFCERVGEAGSDAKIVLI